MCHQSYGSGFIFRHQICPREHPTVGHAWRGNTEGPGCTAYGEKLFKNTVNTICGLSLGNRTHHSILPINKHLPKTNILLSHFQICQNILEENNHFYVSHVGQPFITHTILPPTLSEERQPWAEAQVSPSFSWPAVTISHIETAKERSIPKCLQPETHFFQHNSGIRDYFL